MRSGKPVEGGTEQQIEAAKELCDAQTNPAPDPAGTKACFAACMEKHKDEIVVAFSCKAPSRWPAISL